MIEGEGGCLGLFWRFIRGAWWRILLISLPLVLCYLGYSRFGTFSPQVVAFSEDGTRLAVGGVARIRILDASSEEVLQTVRAGKGVVSLAINRNGTLVAAAGHQNPRQNDNLSLVQVWNIETGEELARQEFRALQIDYLNFRGDGSALAYGTPGQPSVLWRWREGESEARPDLHYVAYEGEEAFYLTTDGTMQRVTNGETVTLLENLPLLPHIALDGDIVALADDNGAVQVWDLASGEQMLDLDAGRQVAAIALRGSRLALAGADGGVLLISLPGGDQQVILAAYPVRGVAFSPDGRRLAIADGEAIRIREE